MRLTRMAWFGGFSMGSGLRLVVLKLKLLMMSLVLVSCQTDKVISIKDLDPYKGCYVRSDGELICPEEKE